MPPRALRCPRDQSPLAPEPHLGVTVDRCPSCRGIWLDATELQVAVDAATKHAETAPTPGPAAWEPVRYLRCPSCEQQMARRNYLRVSGVVVDSCPRCGTWLDGGELERIGAFVARDGGAKVAKAQASLAEQEAEMRRDVERRERVANARAGAGGNTLDLLDALDVIGIFL